MKNAFLKLLIALVCVMGFGNSAAAVSSAPKTQPVINTSWLTTSAAQRAHNDVQIRRLKNLFADKQLEADEYYQRLNKLNETSRKADKTK
jgi:hypothetical protein